MNYRSFLNLNNQELFIKDLRGDSKRHQDLDMATATTLHPRGEGVNTVRLKLQSQKYIGGFGLLFSPCIYGHNKSLRTKVKKFYSPSSMVRRWRTEEYDFNDLLAAVSSTRNPSTSYYK